MSKPDKKGALITGANKGIGFEISRQLARKGITVVAGARSEERGRTACNRLRDAGMEVHFQRIDVTDQGSICLCSLRSRCLVLFLIWFYAFG